MPDAGNAWFASLREHIAECRKLTPIPSRDDLSAIEEFKCQILGGSFVSWFERELPEIEKSRYFFARMKKWELDPFIVITSDMPGLVALEIIIPPSNTVTAYCLREEFESWFREHPDLEFQWHVQHWSYFSAPDDYIRELAEAKYPITPGETYWQHHVGTLWGMRMGSFIDHLWAWDGREMRLLEEAISGGRY